MQEIISYTESKGCPFHRQHAPNEGTLNFLPDSICYNAACLSQQLKAKAIITFTYSGYTALRISSHRPQAAIYAFTKNKVLLRYMSLVWGVRAFYLPKYELLEEAIRDSIDILKQNDLLIGGDFVIHAGSSPFNLQGRTNILKISHV
jgi:pyruvate kinase